jgi:biotin carboxylase
MKNIILCITSYFKGSEFLEQCSTQGNKVVLITSESLKEEPWPWDAIDEVFYMSDPVKYHWNMDHLILGIAHLMRGEQIKRIVALDDFDVEKAAQVREVFRIAGMGQTTQRYFRDKLAMRGKAVEGGINVPAFTAIFNNDEVNAFVQKVAGPWVLKPRSEASATGIKKINGIDNLWQVIDSLGDERHRYLLESFRPGDVYHVDTIVYNGKVVFCSSSKYVDPPMAVSHEGGVFRTMTLDQNSKDAKDLLKLNQELLSCFGLKNGASHSEFIKGRADGAWYFLETSARVGGAYVSDMVEVATGVNLWREWAVLENALLLGQKYKAPKAEKNFAGLLVSLAKEEKPNTDIFQDVTIAKRLKKDYHVGLVFKDKKQEVITQKLAEYEHIIREKYMNILPPTNKPLN